jgi:hypothetical protein
VPDTADQQHSQPQEPKATEPTTSRTAERRALVNSLIREHGSANAALWRLATENKDLRNKNAALRGEDVDGLVMLKGDDARKYQQFLALNVDPAAVAQTITELDHLKAETHTLNTRLTEAQRERQRDEAAVLVGYKPNVLAALEKSQGFRTEVRDVKNDKGEPTRVPYAVVGDDAKPLAEYATAALADFLPALAAGGTAATPNAAPGAPYPATPPRGTAPTGKPGDVVTRHIAQTYVTPSQRQREATATRTAQ